MFTWFLKHRIQESTLVSGHDGRPSVSNDGGTLPTAANTIATRHNGYNTAIAIFLQHGSDDYPSSRM